MFKRVSRLSTALVAGAFLIASGPLIAGYSREAYQNAKSLKAEVLALMDKGTESYFNRTDNRSRYRQGVCEQVCLG
jgi:hypothetical protein